MYTHIIVHINTHIVDIHEKCIITQIEVCIHKNINTHKLVCIHKYNYMNNTYNYTYKSNLCYINGTKM